MRAALIIAAALILGAWVGAFYANKINATHLRLSFGVFMCGIGVYMVYGAVKRLGWV